MSMHKKPLLPHEEAQLVLHGLPVGQPSQLADAFRMGMEAERKRWSEVVFDGWRVLQGLDGRAQKRTSHQNVSDTLDALVRVMKPNTEAQRTAVGGPTGAASSANTTGERT